MNQSLHARIHSYVFCQAIRISCLCFDSEKRIYVGLSSLVQPPRRVRFAASHPRIGSPESIWWCMFTDRIHHCKIEARGCSLDLANMDRDEGRKNLHSECLALYSIENIGLPNRPSAPSLERYRFHLNSCNVASLRVLAR